MPMRWLRGVALLAVVFDVICVALLAISSHYAWPVVISNLFGLLFSTSIVIVLLIARTKREGQQTNTDGLTSAVVPIANELMVPDSLVMNTDPLENRAWLGLVEECVALVDELDRDFIGFDPAGKEVAEHVVCRLREILERSGVQPIVDEATFDRSRHQAAKAVPGMPVIATVSPGFAVGRRVLRRAKVLVHPEQG